MIILLYMKAEFESLFPVEPEYHNPLTQRHDVITLEDNKLCNCVHPTIILNPCIKDLIFQHHNYTFLGRERRVDGRLYPHLKTIFASGKSISIDDLSSCYIVDYSTGERHPMYLLVPCGHCDICKSQKISSFSHRCLLETQCYSSAPWFITLTYSDKKLPKKGSSVEHVQGFIKRFRSHLEYKGIYNKIRYVAVSEYGSNTHRIHYHLLIWNLPSYWKFYHCARFVRKSWRIGFVYCSKVSSDYIVKGTKHKLSKPEKCFEYVAKYMCKDSFVPDGMNQTFMLTSRRHGGIGAPFLDMHKDYIRQYNRFSFEFIDKFSQTKRKLLYCRYVVNRLFPSRYQSVPLELRKSVRFITKFSPLVKRGDKVLNTLRPLFKPFLVWSEITRDDWAYFARNIDKNSPRFWRCCRCSLMYRAFWKVVWIAFKYLDFDFVFAEELDRRRQYVTSMLHRYQVVRQFAPQVHEFRKSKALARQRELL